MEKGLKTTCLKYFKPASETKTLWKPKFSNKIKVSSFFFLHSLLQSKPIFSLLWSSLSPVFFNSLLMIMLPSGIKCLWMQSRHPVVAKLTGDLSFHISNPLTLYIWLLSSAQLPKTILNQHIRRSWRTTYKSIKLDKTILIESLSPNSTRSCFKYRPFSVNHLPNQMHWKHIKTSTNIHIANLFNYYFSSVYQTSNSQFLPIAENPLVFLQDMTVEISMVEALLSSASSNCSSSDPVPTFVFNSCPGLLAPLVTQLFNTIIKSKQWPDFWKCSTTKPILKSGNPENVENYRPISNLPQLSLILGKNKFRFIYSQIWPLICDQ